MSLVGTRPPTVDEWDKYELHHRARLATKPGLTGMWQVSGRSNITDFEEVVKLDKQYISEWTMGLDEDSLNTALYTDLNIRQRLVPEDISNNEKRRGNLKRYSLGTVAEIVGESDCTYFFIALSTFDYNLSAHIMNV